MTITQIALGPGTDSLTNGTVGGFNYGAGGKGNWAQLVADRLANIVGLGPLISSGFLSVANLASAGLGNWAATGFTATAKTDAWYKLPMGVTNVSVLLGIYGSGSTKIATYSCGADIRYPNVGFAVYWIDYASGTTATPSYSTDGGSSWIDFPDAPLRNNSLRKFYVATSLASGGTVKIRGANAAGTATGVCPAGIEVFYLPPSTTTGLIVHNLGVGGADLHDATATTSGDALAWFDSVVLGTGAITNQPSIAIVENVNHVAVENNTTTWNTDLGVINTRLSSFASVGIWSPYELSNASFNTTNQASYRAQTKSSAPALSPAWKLIDFYDALAGNGITGNAQTIAAGLLYDGNHQSQALHFYMADRLYWFIRNNYFSSFAAAPSSYTAKAKQAAVQHKGKRPAVAYSAGIPVGVKL